MARREPTQVNGRQKRKNAKLRHLLLAQILEFEAVQGLIAQLEAAHQTGRKGYPIKVKVAAFLAQILYGVPTITGLVRALKDNPKLQTACGIGNAKQIPCEDALYRFRKKLIENPVRRDAIRRLVNSLALLLPDFGQQVALDGTDIEAYCNTARKELRDKDAAWGKRNFRVTPSGKKQMDDYYGYKLQLLVAVNHEIPVGWRLTPANAADCAQAIPVFEDAKDEHKWFAPEHFRADKGYDDPKIHARLEGKYNCHPLIPLRDMGKDEIAMLDERGCPHCEFGAFEWPGTDYKNKRSKWFCPVRCGKFKFGGEYHGCCSKDNKGEMVWLSWADDPRKHAFVPRRTKQFEKLYNKRRAVEREFSRLKGQFLLDTIRVQGIEKVRLHAELSIFGRLLTALADLSPP